ncbi:MAG: outer membrane lipoprotein chaperone LolA [Lautropia sp.]|nr:outer membrane lipoprotein chaperone LolA [Lautropia sp.]
MTQTLHHGRSALPSFLLVVPLYMVLICGSALAQQGSAPAGATSPIDVPAGQGVTTVEAGGADDIEVNGGAAGAPGTAGRAKGGRIGGAAAAGVEDGSVEASGGDEAKRADAGASTAVHGFVGTGDAIEQLQRFARQTRSATGRFVQTQLGGGRRVMGASAKGRFAFSRPGNFRWEIESPDRQLIVTDGKKLYFYDKDLQQVTIRDASESIQATPAAVLFGVGDLQDSFELNELGSRGGVVWVEAIPKKPDSGFDQIRVGLREGAPVAMEVIDAFGQISRFEFSGLKRDVRLSADHFEFVPPKGVDVLE